MDKKKHGMEKKNCFPQNSLKPLAKQIFIANITMRRARNIKETQQGS